MATPPPSETGHWRFGPEVASFLAVRSSLGSLICEASSFGSQAGESSFPFQGGGGNKKRRGQNCFALVTQSLPLLFFPLPPPSFTAFFLPFLLSAVSQCTAKGELPPPPPSFLGLTTMQKSKCYLGAESKRGGGVAFACLLT